MATGAKAAQWANRILEYGEVNPESVLANPSNWRIHPKPQQDALSGILSDVGLVQSVIINRRTSEQWGVNDRGVETLVDGHLRVQLALSKGQKAIPAVYVDLTPAEENEVLATIDPVAALAVADKDQLDALLREVSTTDEALTKMLAELAKENGLYLTPKAEDPGAQIDRAEELREKWQTESGQLWEVGKHRLLCGDSTKAEDHRRLLIDTKVDLVLTDPPYGVGVNYASYLDSRDNLVELIPRFMPLLTCWPRVLLACGVMAIWDYPKPAWVLAWVHPAAMGAGPWGFTGFNPVLAYGSDPYLAKGMGSRPDSLVMGTDRKGVEGHPTPKPIEAWVWLLERGSAQKGENILDPFLGSGTTMVAAEQLGRICYGMEIEPKYIAVALERLSGMGLEPHLAEAPTAALQAGVANG